MQYRWERNDDVSFEAGISVLVEIRGRMEKWDCHRHGWSAIPSICGNPNMHSTSRSKGCPECSLFLLDSASRALVRPFQARRLQSTRDQNRQEVSRFEASLHFSVHSRKSHDSYSSSHSLSSLIYACCFIATYSYTCSTTLHSDLCDTKLAQAPPSHFRRNVTVLHSGFVRSGSCCHRYVC